MTPRPPIHEPLDSALRWQIKSRTVAGESYLVDLGANEGWGECQCMWYNCSVVKDLKLGKIPRVCQHVIEAEIRFKNWAKREFAKHDKNTQE